MSEEVTIFIANLPVGIRTQILNKLQLNDILSLSSMANKSVHKVLADSRMLLPRSNQQQVDQRVDTLWKVLPYRAKQQFPKPAELYAALTSTLNVQDHIMVINVLLGNSEFIAQFARTERNRLVNSVQIGAVNLSLLHIATMLGHEHMSTDLVHLCDHTAVLESRDNLTGGNPLHWACQQLNLPMMRALANKISPTHTNARGFNALHMVCQQQDATVEHVQWLIEQGAQINAQNEDTLESALFLAICQGNDLLVDYLLDQGADATQIYLDHKTLLHVIARESMYTESAHRKASLARTLPKVLAKGADVQVVDDNGKLAFEYTENKTLKQIFKHHILTLLDRDHDQSNETAKNEL